MSYISEAYANAAKTLIPKFEKRGMPACYCATKEEAKEKILSMMPKGSSISLGGSESLVESGIMAAIRNGDYEVLDRHDGKTPEEVKAIYSKCAVADFHLMSTNAFTADGMLVNIDGASNRVACLCFGPDKVIILASMNKMCADVESAFKRIRTLACPANAIRVKANTPCAVTGVCSECLSPGCICDQFVVTRKSRVIGRINIVLCGEKLGF